MTVSSHPAELTGIQFEVLRDAVNLARNVPTNSLETLKVRLRMRKHAESDITAAISFWSQHEKTKAQRDGPPARS